MIDGTQIIVRRAGELGTGPLLAFDSWCASRHRYAIPMGAREGEERRGGGERGAEIWHNFLPDLPGSVAVNNGTSISIQ